MSWSVTLPWMRTRSGFIFGGWFCLLRKKVTSIIAKQLIHSFRCLSTFFFSYKCFILRESVREELPWTSTPILIYENNQQQHQKVISWHPRATWKLDRRIPGKADVLLLKQPYIFPDFSENFRWGSGEPTATGTVLKTFAFSHLMWIKRDFFARCSNSKMGRICWTDFGKFWCLCENIDYQ